MPSDQDPIRDQLIEARRNQILDAAAGVFAEKGFHRTTTKEIASAAGVSEGTIYNYFANKVDLLIGMITRLADVQQLPEDLAATLHSDPQEFLLMIARDRMQRIQQHHQVLQAVLPEILIDPGLRERFYQHFVRPIAVVLEQYVQARMELGDIRVINAPLTVRAIQSMFAGLMILRIVGDEALLSGWEDMPEVLVRLIFDGLRPRDGA